MRQEPTNDPTLFKVQTSISKQVTVIDELTDADTQDALSAVRPRRMLRRQATAQLAKKPEQLRTGIRSLSYLSVLTAAR